MRIEPRLERSEQVQSLLDDAGLDAMEYDTRWGRYRIRLAKGDITKHQAALRDLLKTAYEASK